nr:MAG TPA: hypothetical protein [Caudoviricetes sp.]
MFFNRFRDMFWRIFAYLPTYINGNKKKNNEELL